MEFRNYGKYPRNFRNFILNWVNIRNDVLNGFWKWIHSGMFNSFTV